jgi:hypothetical protein
MTMNTGGHQIEGVLGPYTNAGAPTAGTDEVQTLRVTADDSLGGTYKLKFEGFITDELADDADDAAVEAALVALPSIGAGGVSVSEGSAGVFEVTFDGNLAKKAVGLIEQHEFDGDNVTVEISETTPGVDATARGAAKGATLVDITNGKEYINTGTALEPTWTVKGAQS